MNTRFITLLAVAALGLAAAGCGPDVTIEFRYDRPPIYSVPETVRTLAIAEFTGRTGQDKRWGEVAADQIMGDLDRYNRKFNRYQLVDRGNLKRIMDERDVTLAISDTATAVRLGKMANAQAIVYGNIQVNARDETRQKTKYDYAAKRSYQVSYQYRYCLVTMQCTLADVNTGRIIASVPAKYEYDSDKDTSGESSGAAFLRELAGDPKNPAPLDQVVEKLVANCCAQFVNTISPHEEVVKEKLLTGTNKQIQTGNKLALEKDYKGALEFYQAAMAEEPKNDAPVFNAGVMHEANGDLKTAGEMYDKAFRMKAQQQYIKARTRVRNEMKNSTPPDAPAPAPAAVAPTRLPPLPTGDPDSPK